METIMTEKFALKNKNPNSEIKWYNVWTESLDDVARTMTWNTASEAEYFRSRYELTAFTVEPYIDE